MAVWMNSNNVARFQSHFLHSFVSAFLPVGIILMARWLSSSPHSQLFSQLPQGKRSSLLLSVPTKVPEMSLINTQERDLWPFCKGHKGARWEMEKGVGIVALKMLWEYVLRSRIPWNLDHSNIVQQQIGAPRPSIQDLSFFICQLKRLN